MRKLLIWLMILVPMLVVIAALAWTSGVFQKPEIVELVEVKLASLHRSIFTNGKVEAERVNDLRAPVSGVCRWTDAREGSHLAQGQAVVRIEDPSVPSQKAAAQAELDAALLDLRDIERGPAPEESNQAEADLAKAQLAVENARNLVQTNEWLLARESISRFEAEQSRKGLMEAEQALKAATTRRDDLRARFGDPDRKRAQSRVAAAQARLQYLDEYSSRLIVRAPADGTLYEFNVRDGVFVNAGDSIGLFADLRQLRLRAYVDEPDIGQVSVGENVVIQWDAHSQERWRGKVVQMAAQVVELGTRSVAQVLCSIENDRGILLPNVNVNVEIEVPETQPVASLPRGVVFPDGTREFVWMVGAGKPEKRYIGTGRSTSALIEITSGLKAGDKVIDPGGTAISENLKIAVKSK
jgi:HlyD family secretion protein